QLLDSFTVNAAHYAAVLNPSDELWNRYPESLKYHLEMLHFIRVTQGRPLLLAAVQRFKDQPQQLEKVLKTVLNWSVRLLISGRLGSGSLEEKYGEVARALNKGEIKTIAEMTEKFSPYVPTDAQFEAAFATADVSKAYLAKYYLITLEQHVRTPNQKDDPHWDVSKRGGVNLEHILPKSLKEARKPLGEWVFRLGNIVLMQASKNAQLGSADYSPRKSEALSASDFVLTQEAGGKKHWGPDEISERQSRLAKLAVSVWPIRVGGK
ncbi:MAG: HNH endonuclease family protein, partial [Terriglobia bacterium]|nr:HNH endonuclease family protein [Terriglobia bacterium]